MGTHPIFESDFDCLTEHNMPFANFFGKGKGKQPTPQEAIQKLRETEDMLNKKAEFLEKRIADEVAAAKKAGTKNKRVALSHLKRKKRLEKQQEQIDGTLTTIEFQREALENAQSNTEILNTMDYSSKALKGAMGNMDVDKVDDMMADIQDAQDTSNEIADAIARPMGMQDDIDEDDLLAELEEMEQEELDAELLGVGSDPVPDLDLPTPGTSLPAALAKKKQAEDDELDELAAWA